MSVSNVFLNKSPAELTFGFYTDSHPFLRNSKSDILPLAIIHNVLNVVDWIPLIGIISGIFRCIITGVLAKNNQDILTLNREETAAAKKWLITEGVRGVVSALSLGFIFCIPDLLFYATSRD